MIRTKGDLEAKYFFLKCLESIPLKIDRDGMKDELIRDTKSEIRAYYKREAKRLEELSKVRGYSSENGEYVTSFYKLANGNWDEHDVDEYFMENEFVPAPCSQYDCTGKWFTTSYHILKYKGGWYVIHHTAMDV